MDEEQRFAFATWGFLTVEDALSSKQVADLKATVDEKGPDLPSQHEAIEAIEAYFVENDAAFEPFDPEATW